MVFVCWHHLGKYSNVILGQMARMKKGNNFYRSHLIYNGLDQQSEPERRSEIGYMDNGAYSFYQEIGLDVTVGAE